VQKEEYRHLFMPAIVGEVMSQGKFDMSAYNNIKRYCTKVDNKSDNILQSIYQNIILPICNEL
jgi:hypothetical protein